MARIQHIWSQLLPFWTVQPAFEVDTIIGLEFTPTRSHHVTAIRWNRASTSVAERPLHLGLYNVATETMVAETTDFNDDDSPGWQRVPLSSPVEIAADDPHVIMALFPAASVIYQRQIPPALGLALPNVEVPAQPGRIGTADWPAPPATEQTGLAPGLDLDMQIEPIDLAPVTKQDLDVALDSWFNGYTAPQPVTFPAEYWYDQTATRDTGNDTNQQIYNIEDQITGVSTGVMGYLNTNLGTNEEWAASAHPKLVSWLAALLAVLADALTTLAFLHDLFPAGHTPSDHDASLAAHRAATEPDGETLPSYIEGEIEIVLSAVTDQTNEITQILAHGDGTEDVPTIVGESDWGNIFRFDVPADFYVVDITTTDVDAAAEDVAGTSVWDHLGFCIPLTVDGLPEYGPRLAIGGQVIRTGRQMGGIILNGRRVLSGHVTAYKYQPA